MASRSSQLFCHNALDIQTDTQTTDVPGDKTCINTHLRSIDYIATWLIITRMVFTDIARVHPVHLMNANAD